MFELHVNQNGDWKRLKTFDGRQTAMSAAFELERAGRYSGTKVIELAYDPQALATKKKLLHRWSAQDDARAEQQEMEENFDRQRQRRKQIRAKQKIEAEGRKKWIRTAIALSSLALVVILGVAGMLMLGAR